MTWLALLQQGLLATYLIPGCVGRRVKLGSENSSSAGADDVVWKSGNLEIWEFGDLGIWRSGDLKIQKFGVQQMKKIKFSKSKSVLPKMSARSGLVGQKNFPAPFGAIPGHFLRGPEKSKNCPNFAYFPWWANGPYSPGLGPCCYPPLVGK